MKKDFSKRFTAGFMILLMNVNIYQAAAAQSFTGNPQLMKDVQVLDGLSKKFNANSQAKQKTADILSSFEKLMGRKLSTAERGFLSLQFAAMKVLPRFEVKDNTIQVYDMNEGSKDLLLSLEVVDSEKNTFRFGKHTFKVDPNKAIHENIQIILKELQKGEQLSFLESMNLFGIPSAHAAMAPWMKLLLIGAVALVVGIFIGKAMQKNKDKKDSYVAESSFDDSDSGDDMEDDSSEAVDHGSDTASTSEEASGPQEEALPTSGEEPAVV
ncbi:MAG: hypothetical protein R3A80_09520 [Bdellovibrionota bacterium]